MKTKFYWMISVLVIASFILSVTVLPIQVEGKGKPQKIVFIHYKKGHAKPTCNNNGICEPELGEKKNCADCKNGGGEESTCYTFLGKGVKWRDLPVNYVIHPDLDTGAISSAASEWDSHTSANLVGSYSIDNGATWDDETPDGRNEMVFGDYSQSGVIAVTIIWGYFNGKPNTREILEFDILFDTDFTWGDATKDPSVMDLQNIATHEFGHGFGLGDLYNSACVEETMYGYSWEGDTQKRDLNAGDIVGIQQLYG
ncbi:MAG: matrixin family metalloprotease [Candidatus Aenigmarchaeota archaeon]|nr:matrixin family metalloprotease [Candidatus Aenigmarchaeota archaeon]NIQ18071.1 matrixin family metalloprotease [Candidatus Aenigmarchaeota archaeon]